MTSEGNVSARCPGWRAGTVTSRVALIALDCRSARVSLPVASWPGPSRRSKSLSEFAAVIPLSTDSHAERRMGLVGATGVGVGAIVGGGILALAGVAFAATGPAAIVAFGLNGLIALLTALSFAEMSSKFPESGGTYTFARKVMFVEAAASVGWVVWFASVVAAALYAMGFAHFALIVLNDLWERLGAAPDWLHDSRAVTGVAIGTTLTLSCGLAWRPAGGGQWANIGKLTVFAILILGGLWGLGRVSSGQLAANFRPFFSAGFAGLIQAMGYTFIALQGFDLVAAVGGEVHEPARNLPRAIILSLLIALAIYLPLLCVITAVGTPPGESISTAAAEDPEGIVAIAAQNYLGSFGYWLVIVAAVLSMFSALQANLFAASRIAQVMARDRTLPSPLATLSKQTSHSRGGHCGDCRVGDRHSDRRARHCGGRRGREFDFPDYLCAGTLGNDSGTPAKRPWTAAVSHSALSRSAGRRRIGMYRTGRVPGDCGTCRGTHRRGLVGCWRRDVLGTVCPAGAGDGCLRVRRWIPNWSACAAVRRWCWCRSPIRRMPRPWSRLPTRWYRATSAAS